MKFLIAVIDDNPKVRKVFQVKLEAAGFEVATSPGGEEAVYLVRVAQPDMVLLGLFLSEIDGLEILKRIREDPKTKDIPVIMLTNPGEESQLAVAQRLGAVDNITKTGEVSDDVTSKISSMLAGKKPRLALKVEELPRGPRKIIKFGAAAVIPASPEADAYSKNRGEMAALAAKIEELKTLVYTTEGPAKKEVLEASKKITEDDLKTMEERIKSEAEKKYSDMKTQFEAEKSKLVEALDEKEQLLKLKDSERDKAISDTLNKAKREMSEKERMWEEEIVERGKMLERAQAELIALRRLRSITTGKTEQIKKLEDEIKQFKSDLTHVQHAKSDEELVAQAEVTRYEPAALFKGHYKFLIIEDDPILARLYKTKLQILGQMVMDAGTGGRGLELMRQEKPDLILLDLMLPDIDGIEILEEMKSGNIHIPVIVLTNLDAGKVIAQAKGLGAKAYLIKSETTPKIVLEKMREVLGSAKK